MNQHESTKARPIHQDGRNRTPAKKCLPMDNRNSAKPFALQGITYPIERRFD